MCQVIAADCESECTVKPGFAGEPCDSNNSCPDCSEILAKDEMNVSWKDGKLNGSQKQGEAMKRVQE